MHFCCVFPFVILGHRAKDAWEVGKAEALKRYAHLPGSEFDAPVETGFQLAVSQGPLCGEPVHGLAFFVEKFDVDVDSIERELGV